MEYFTRVYDYLKSYVLPPTDSPPAEQPHQKTLKEIHRERYSKQNYTGSVLDEAEREKIVGENIAEREEFLKNKIKSRLRNQELTKISIAQSRKVNNTKIYDEYRQLFT